MYLLYFICTKLYIPLQRGIDNTFYAQAFREIKTFNNCPACYPEPPASHYYIQHLHH